jgi:hypothetical protein
MVSWHVVSPRIALASLVVAVLVIDWFRLGLGMESVGYLNLAVLWLFAQQLGFWYADGSFAGLSRRTLWAVVAASFAVLFALTWWGPYPVSMVGMPGQTSNMTPPTVCLLVLSVAQMALALLARDRVSRWLQRPVPWAGVVPFSSMAMTVYLWHLSVLVLAFLALFGLGFTPPVPGSGLWWLTRPFWLLGLALVLAVVATLLSPLERGRAARLSVPRPLTRATAITATTVSGLGAALISFGLLGYVASGLLPAAHGSSVLLFVPVDPIQNTVCVLAGFALSTLSTRGSASASEPDGQPTRKPRRSARVSTPIGLPPLMTRIASSDSSMWRAIDTGSPSPTSGRAGLMCLPTRSARWAVPA